MISWSEVKGEGSVGFTDNFHALHPTTKLDVLQDAMHSLQEKYDEVYNDAKKELT
ncbi:hypothetical protein [Flavobacterium sp.]|uniref:hypothetical protein n=1 Tax=Flavobacterium sp. TaxID=239 RepID=UPI0037BF84FC